MITYLWSSSGRSKKLVMNKFYLYLHTSSCVTVIHARLISWCHWKSRIGTVDPGFLLTQGSHLAPWDLKPGVPVEVLLSRGHVDVDGFLEWQFSRPCPVHHCDLFPSDGVMILPSMLCYCWLLEHPTQAGILVLLQSGIRFSLGLTNACRPYHSCRGSCTQPSRTNLIVRSWY